MWNYSFRRCRLLRTKHGLGSLGDCSRVLASASVVRQAVSGLPIRQWLGFSIVFLSLICSPTIHCSLLRTFGSTAWDFCFFSSAMWGETHWGEIFLTVQPLCSISSTIGSTSNNLMLYILSPVSAIKKKRLYSFVWIVNIKFCFSYHADFECAVS